MSANFEPHVVREVVNNLTSIARTAHGSEQLRELIACALGPLMQTAPAPAVPSGWKLVPVEPTEAMLTAGALAHKQSPAHDFEGPIHDAWSAMLKAAPTPPAQSESVQLGELAKRNIYDAIRGAYDLGYNDARNARAVPGDSAPGYKGRNVEADHGGALINSLNQRLRSATAVPESADGGQAAQKPATGWRLLHEDLDEANKLWDAQKYTYAGAGSTVISWGPDKRLYVFDMPALTDAPTPPAQSDDDGDVTGQPGPLPEHGWDGGPAAPTDQMEINIRICVPPDFARRGDMQSIIEREIKADRWSWHDLPAVPEDVARVNQQMLEALEAIASDYAERFDLSSPSTNPGIKSTIAQARAAIDATRAVAEKGGAT